MPKNKPEIITVPTINFIAVRGKGNPNEEGGEYKQAMSILYGVAFTIKMSYKGSHKIDGYFQYVVPPLEGFWWMDNMKEIDYHEIYLSDARRCSLEKLKTVIRHPIKKR